MCVCQQWACTSARLANRIPSATVYGNDSPTVPSLRRGGISPSTARARRHGRARWSRMSMPRARWWAPRRHSSPRRRGWCRTTRGLCACVRRYGAARARGVLTGSCRRCAQCGEVRETRVRGASTVYPENAKNSNSILSSVESSAAAPDGTDDGIVNVAAAKSIVLVPCIVCVCVIGRAYCIGTLVANL